MKIEQAKRLQYGSTVHCPADRGEAPYAGVVRYIGLDVFKNIHGVEYVWITVSRKHGASSHVWPSNRLS